MGMRSSFISAFVPVRGRCQSMIKVPGRSRQPLVGHRDHPGRAPGLTCEFTMMGWDGMSSVGGDSSPSKRRLVSRERQHLGEMIKALAERTGKQGLETQAAAVGIPKSTLHRWITGEVLPSQERFGTLLMNAELPEKY